MKVESLTTGPLEPTSEPYATAKIARMKLCESYRKQYNDPFITGIPADAFGPGDDFSMENSHVVAAVLRKMHDAMIRGASSVTLWGTGKPRREFLFVDDLADACIFVMENYDGSLPINLGGGTEQSIAELAGKIRDLIGYSGEIIFDPNFPDGMPFKALDSQMLRDMGWKARTPFREALQKTYDEFLKLQVEHSDVR